MKACKSQKSKLLMVALLAGMGFAPAVAQGSVALNVTQDSAGSATSAPTTKDKQKSAGAHPTASSVTPPADDQVYRIGVEDELQISVWREPELSTTAVVRPDGKITMPLLNDVEVIGLRPEELQSLIGEKLKPFINEPQVTVIPKSIHSRKVYLMGNVGKQGSFPLNGTKTVLELIADAGGLTQFAKSGSIYILRTENGKKTKIPFNYKKAVAGKADSITLQPGDLVVVP